MNLYNCKNNHNINNILINEFENMEKIDISKIICDNCKKKKKKKKNNAFQKEFYRCNFCKINLCRFCKSNHYKSHKIVNYNNK